MLCLCYTCVMLLLETLGVFICVWDKTHSLLGVNAGWCLGCIFNMLFLKKTGWGGRGEENRGHLGERCDAGREQRSS